MGGESHQGAEMDLGGGGCCGPGGRKGRGTSFSAEDQGHWAGACGSLVAWCDCGDFGGGAMNWDNLYGSNLVTLKMHISFDPEISLLEMSLRCAYWHM